MGYWEPEVGRLETRMWEKDYKECKISFHIMFMRQAAGKKCELVWGDYLRLWFSMRAVVDRYFQSFLFPKLTPMRPNLHKQTVGDLCHLACGCRLQQLLSTSLACDLLDWGKLFSWPPITDCMWRHIVLCNVLFLLPSIMLWIRLNFLT